MKWFCTRIMALDPQDGELKHWAGPYVPGINFETAQQYCDQNGLGYCVVIGELESETNERTGETREYFKEQLN